MVGDVHSESNPANLRHLKALEVAPRPQGRRGRFWLRRRLDGEGCFPVGVNIIGVIDQVAACRHEDDLKEEALAP